MLPIVIAVVIALLLKSFVFANAVVPTGSMISTINEGDRIIASRVAYIKSDPQRYDIILFKFPDDESQIFVKRIIGMPGETVTVENGIAYITDENGNTVETDQSFVTNEKPEGNYGPYYIPKEGEKITVNGTQCIAENGMTVGSLEFLDKYCKKDESGNYTVSEKCYFFAWETTEINPMIQDFWNNTYVAENKILGQAEFKYYPGFEKLK
ncbi:MAG: signal peptidase I [Anaerotruncus sp.]|nr:MAG: signal peptidase I [Anaerotruncus sp.]